MNWKLSCFRAGDLVEVRSLADVLATLDQDGCLDGMPFMPEMLQYCGKQFRVRAVAHKTCDAAVEKGTGRKLQAAVHLAGLVCDGSAHGGCQAECSLFWKDEWLKPASTKSAAGQAPASGCGGCSESRLLDVCQSPVSTSGEEVRYSCQATKLYAATQPLSPWDARQYFFDFITGNRSFGQVCRGTFLTWLRWLVPRMPIGFRVFRAFAERMHQWLTGRAMPSLNAKIEVGKKTPTGTLDLQPGEWVRVKSKEQIEATLDQSAKNRGLMFDKEEMAPFCGRVFKVRRRIMQILDEATGAMLPMKQPCITLEGVFCNSEYATCRLNCPREYPSYWREIWLERVKTSNSSTESNEGRAAVAERLALASSPATTLDGPVQIAS